MGCDKTTPVADHGRGQSSTCRPSASRAARCSAAIARPGDRLGHRRDRDERAGARRQAHATQDFLEAESCMNRSHGHCMTMGTACTMACMVEALGVGLPGNAAFPAVDARRNVIARMAGRRIVEMVHEDLVLSKILTREAFENAIRTLRGDRRLDQRRDPPDRDRRPHRRRARARGLRPSRQRAALPRRTCSRPAST